MDNKFWETKSLFEMSHREWESVCDGCGKCCLTQLQDEDTNQLVFTDVVCDLLDNKTCKCTDYENRSTRVPTCMTMDATNVEACAKFAPNTCSYRLLVEGKPLPDWHHLLSGNEQMVHDNEQSVKDKIRYLKDIDTDDLEDYVVNWP